LSSALQDLIKSKNENANYPMKEDFLQTRPRVKKKKHGFVSRAFGAQTANPLLLFDQEVG
jgi:hypothetical protein